jgi:ABC-type branched-subunit amino acid transport system substrate-binding protein
MVRDNVRIAMSVALVGVLVAACGTDRETADTTAPTGAVVSTEAPAPTGTEPPTATDAPATTEPTSPMFGDEAWPCGPGDGANTDAGAEVGVTVDSVTIGAGDDAGFASSPGLNHEMTDAMKALVAKCNELGGINGRTINLNYYDAKLLEVQAAMQSACDGDNFFMVGQGWVFDGSQEELRLQCGLPTVPAYAVSAAFAHGKDMFQGVPNPSDETTSGVFEQIATIFPDEVEKVATLTGAIAATVETRDKILEVAPQYGWEFVSTTLESNPAGETDWTPFVKQIQDSGATMISWQGTCLPGLLAFAQTAKINGLDVPIVVDSNHYSAQCAAANDGALDNLFIRMAFVPFEDASENPATQDYLDLISEYGGDTAMLGVQATSSFLLWATTASACGAELTRACVLDNLEGTTAWTGHGLHAETNPGENHPPTCSSILRLVGNTYERVVPEEAATFECDDSWIAPITSTAALAEAKLDENRISQQYTGG